MVTRLINSCGLYLGSESELAAPAWDNQEGFWENIHFVEINDRILQDLNSGWDLPPATYEGWNSVPEISVFRTEATDLIKRFGEHEPWGWKDPRNSLTLPFWTDLFPDLKVLICLRHPLEVAQSLHARNFSSIAFGLQLWQAYNQRLISSVRVENRVVTHYDSYFHDPQRELRRVVDLLNIAASNKEIEQACLNASTGMRHQRVPIENLSAGLPSDVLKTYLQLCIEAGPVCEALHRQEGVDVQQQLYEIERISKGKVRRAADLATRLHEKDNTIRALSETVSSLTELLKTQAAQLEEVVRAQEESASAFEEQISILQKALSDSEKDRQQGAALAADLETQIGSLNQANAELAKELECWARNKEILSSQLSAKAHEVERITRSPGWKLLNRYGHFKYRHLLPVYRMLGLHPYSQTKNTENGFDRFTPTAHRDESDLAAILQPGHETMAIPLTSTNDLLLQLESNAYDVICFPIIDWDFRFQRPQQLMSRFADAGHRVFYVASASHASGPAYIIREKRKNVYEVALRGFQQVVYADLMGEKERDVLFESLDELRRDMLMGATVAFAQLPFWWPLARKTRTEFAWPIVYDCMDHHAGFSTNKKVMVDQEQDLLAGADLVLASSAFLHEQAVKHNANVLLVPNACDYAHFAKVSSKASGDRTVIGYYGAIADWFDSDLVADLAERRPDWDFVLVGSTFSADLRRLSKLPNVSLPGEKHYAEIPDWLAQFDVAIIPFKRIELTEATNPVKAYEILASGKPVVSVPIPEVAALAPLVRLASTAEEFEKEINAALAENQPELVAQRRRFAKENTWDKRYETLAPVVRDSFPKVSIVVVTFNNVQLNRLCLESIYRRTEWPNFEVIVVDNNSSDATPEYLREAVKIFPNLRVILNESNLGFAAGNNIGLRQAFGDYLVLLNNDTVVTRGWLSNLIRHLHANPEIGMIGPVTNSIGNEAKVDIDYTNLDQMPAWAAGFVQQHAGTVFEIPMLAMFCVAMRREVFEKVGFLDERFGLGLFEDDDYTLRIKTSGFRVACAADVFIHHFGQASFKELVKNGEYQGLFDENRRRFEQKWDRKWTPHQYASVELKRKAASGTAGGEGRLEN
jgi:GT2 family glycosyltransferase/glycosyltransferase involved in cell wall biosynthesis/predicted  nucleic acid-binding Zn-ribbon protein